jgi:hypothetical protein
MPIRVFFCDAMVADSQSFSPTRTSLRRSFARGSVSTDGGRGEDLRVAFQSDVSVDKTQALGYIGNTVPNWRLSDRRLLERSSAATRSRGG